VWTRSLSRASAATSVGLFDAEQQVQAAAVRQRAEDTAREFQASYFGPDGKRHFTPHRFQRERDADRWRR
jgi:hypothetical protein